MKGRLLAGLLLLGSAGLAASANPAEGMHALWIDVPFVVQTTDGCGSASIAMVMQYWDRKQGRAIAVEENPQHIQATLFSPAAHGIFSSSMRSYFEQAGYQAFAFSGQWNDFERELALGRPMIVGIQPSGPHGSLHYVVVVGVDSARGYVLVNDPAQQKMLRISREGFEREWRATRNWTLLAVPKTAH